MSVHCRVTVRYLGNAPSWRRNTRGRVRSTGRSPFMSTSIVITKVALHAAFTDKSLVYEQWGTVGPPQAICKIFIKLCLTSKDFRVKRVHHNGLLLTGARSPSLSAASQTKPCRVTLSPATNATVPQGPQRTQKATQFYCH